MKYREGDKILCSIRGTGSPYDLFTITIESVRANDYMATFRFDSDMGKDRGSSTFGEASIENYVDNYRIATSPLCEALR